VAKNFWFSLIFLHKKKSLATIRVHSHVGKYSSVCYDSDTVKHATITHHIGLRLKS